MSRTTIDSSLLVDISTIQVDSSLPREFRIAEFIRQIKNPYHFKCGKFTIRTKYAKNGLTLEDCLRQMMSWNTA